MPSLSPSAKNCGSTGPGGPSTFGSSAGKPGPKPPGFASGCTRGVTAPAASAARSSRRAAKSRRSACSASAMDAMSAARWAAPPGARAAGGPAGARGTSVS
eukprot:2996772-Lingulodinium_polyedra.AAC.1